MTQLSDQLRACGKGVEEWRVANPKTGTYCMARSQINSINPEREAKEWLADHQRKFPQHEFSSYEVKCVMAQNDADLLMLAAADEIDRLNKALEDIAYSGRTRTGMKELARKARSPNK